jgi:hypothetical protein
MTLLVESATKRLPEPSPKIAVGLRLANRAEPPSPEYPSWPLPAIVVMRALSSGKAEEILARRKNIATAPDQSIPV